MPDAPTTETTTTEPAPAPAPATTAPESKPGETNPAPAEAISEELGEAGKAALQKERAARAVLERKLTEAEQLKTELAAKVQEFEDAKKSETEKLNDQLARLQQQIADKDAEVAAAKVASLRAEVAAEKKVPAKRLHGSTREELEADADAYLAEVAEQTASKRPTKPATPATGLKSGASADGDASTNPRARAAAALRQMRQGT